MTSAVSHQFRPAGPADAAAVRELDDLAFGSGGQPADPGELEAGVDAGDIHVLVQQGVPVGYLHADTSRAGRIYVAGVAVHPDRQGQGLGSALIDHMLGLLGAERQLTPVVTVTSPDNVRMLKALLQRGFAARWFLPDHFGPGQHRFGCQLLAVTAATDRPGVVRVPASRLDEIPDLMRTRGFMIRSIRGDLVSGTEFELVPMLASDFLPADPPDRSVDPAEKHLDRLQQAIRDDLKASHNGGMW